jgi:hypothetical protein
MPYFPETYFPPAYFPGGYFGGTGAATDWGLVPRQRIAYTSRVNVYRAVQPVDPATKERVDVESWALVYQNVPCLYGYTQNDSDPTGAGRVKRRSMFTEDMLCVPVRALIQPGDLVKDVTPDSTDNRGENAGTIHRVMGQPRALPNAGSRRSNRRVYQLFQEEKPPADLL